MDPFYSTPFFIEKIGKNLLMEKKMLFICCKGKKMSSKDLRRRKKKENPIFSGKKDRTKNCPKSIQAVFYIYL